ncbi:MAG TPA: hypothetical protein VIK86_05535 [Candidatus Paceibacterota bacterium]
MKEFKVGDKVAILCVVTDNEVSDFDFPINLKITGSKGTSSCTADGKFFTADTKQNVFHLEDLQKSEYPKWMMVANDNTFLNKRYVIYKHHDKYIAIKNATSEIDLEFGYYDTGVWDYAKDIEEEIIEEMTMEQVNKALGKKIKIVE